jgi:hypothetical protein
MKSSLMIVGFLLLSGCSDKNATVQVNDIPAKKTFVKKEKSTAPSNRNGYYPPMGVIGGGGYAPIGYPAPMRHGYVNRYNRGGDYNYYIEPLGNGPLSYQNSAEDIENQQQGRD